ncbi:MAG: hypothetical protein ACQEWV_00840 [Bacillota bacterium]
MDSLSCYYIELPKIRVYDLRHTHDTFLIGVLGINSKVVQERLGHSNIKTKPGTYSHVLPSMQLEVTHTLDQSLK